MIERAAAARRAGARFPVCRRSARVADALLSEHADARAAARGVGRGPCRVPVPAPVVAPGAGGRADRHVGRHRARPLHHAMRARLGRGPVRRDGRQHQDASFGFRGSARHRPAPVGGRNGEFLAAVPDRRSEPGAASGRAGRGLDRRQRTAGHRPRGTAGGGLDREPRPHPRGGARAGRSLSRALRRLRQGSRAPSSCGATSTSANRRPRRRRYCSRRWAKAIAACRQKP